MYQRTLLRFLYLVLPWFFWPGSTGLEAPRLLIVGLGASVLLAMRGVSLWKTAGAGLSISLSRPRSRLTLFTLGLMICLTLSLINATTYVLALRTILLVALWLIIALETAASVRRSGDVSALLAAFVIGTIPTAVFALLQILGVGQQRLDVPMIGGSFLGNRNYVAGLVAGLLPVTLILVRSSQGARRGVWLSIVVLFAGTLAACGALGPMLALAAVTCLWGVYRLVRHRQSLVSGAAIYIWLLLAIFMTWGLFTANELFSTRISGDAGSQRLANWYISLRMFQDHPLTGVGAGHYAVEWPMYRHQLTRAREMTRFPLARRRSIWAHNDYLQFVAETGLVGVILMLLAGGVFIRRLYRFLASDPVDPEKLLLTTSLNVILLHALVSFPFHLPVTMMIFALICGLLSAESSTSATSTSVSLTRRPSAVVAMVLAVMLAVVMTSEFRQDLRQARGVRQYRAGLFRLSADNLDAALRLRLWPGDGHFYQGLAHAALNQSAAAEASYKRSLRFAPTYRTYLLLAELELDSSRIPVARAQLDFLDTFAVELETRLDTRYLRGRIALLENDPHSAQHIWRGLLEDAPRYHRAMIGLGYLAARQGRTEEALRIYSGAEDLLMEKMNSAEPALVLRYQADLQVLRRGIVDTRRVSE